MTNTEHNQKLLATAVRKNDLKTVKKMILSGSDVNTLGPCNDSLLFIASENGNLDIVSFLLFHQADVHLLNNARHSALHAACKGGNVEIVKMLVKGGVSIKGELTPSQMMPITLAFSYLSVEVIKFFVEYNLIEKEDFSKIYYRNFNKDTDKGNKILDIIFLNAQFNDENFIKREFKKLIHSNSVECVDHMFDLFPFLTAQLMEYLEDAYSCFEFECEKEDDYSYDHSILKKHLFDSYTPGKNRMFDLFQRRGLGMNALDSKGQTLLHYTAMEYNDEYENFDYLRILLDTGYEIDCRNARSQTALQVAIESGLFYHALYLVYKGANVKAVDEKNKTVLNYAQSFITMGLEHDDEYNLEYKDDLINLLKDYGA